MHNMQIALQKTVEIVKQNKMKNKNEHQIAIHPIQYNAMKCDSMLFAMQYNKL